MTENSMFFSDGSWYTQNMFARFISDIFGEGVVADIDDELEVSANSPANMAVQVKTGRSYVKGYIHEILTDAVQLTISDADTTNPRIDRIVLRLDVNTNRRIRVAVLQGTAAASPVAPTLTQTSSVWEISLAQVYVSANATVINTANITDERTYMAMHRKNLPVASTTALGSVKVGNGITVTSDGTISRSTPVYTYTIAPSSSSFTLYSGSSVTLVALPPGDSCSGTIRTNWSSAYTGYTLNAICHKTDGTVSVIVLSQGDTTTTIPSGTNTLTINDNAAAGAGAISMTVYGLTITRNNT